MAYNKVTKYEDSENILESEIGLVTKTYEATQSLASTIDGRKVIKAGTLFNGASTDVYTEVTSPSGNPKTLGYYELVREEYVLTTDTEVDETATYYEKTTNTERIGIVFQDCDMTDYESRPIAVVVAGRVYEDKVSTDAAAQKATFAAQGLYLV